MISPPRNHWNEHMNACVVILAAGASTRMGQSKQLLAWKGQTLLNHAIDTALGTDAPVMVVLGANEEEHKESLKNRNVTIVSNPDWQSGMGSSVKAGVRAVRQGHPSADAFIIMVCDQPHVTKEHLNALWQEYSQSKKLAVVSRYADTTGVPALFSRQMYDYIFSLADSQGAKGIIQKLKPEEVVAIDLKDGEKDIDTPGDYFNFKPKV
jgi:molybdenum cofactor cytidylyltransferase